MLRQGNRAHNALRPVRIIRGYTKYAEGSVLIEIGDTRVLCTASVEQRVPPFLKGTGRGWVTAEYGMLPRSTAERTPRDAARGRLSGRTMEIQRLVGRALRSVVDLDRLGERTITLDCDVIQADGGTRTAAITGAFVALVDCLDRLFPGPAGAPPAPQEPGGGGDGGGGGGAEPDPGAGDARNARLPVSDFLAAVSVGIVEGRPLLDLDFLEDSRAEVDMNVVGTSGGLLVEVQGTAEGSPFSRSQMNVLLDLAQEGIAQLIQAQKAALGERLAARVGGGVQC